MRHGCIVINEIEADALSDLDISLAISSQESGKVVKKLKFLQYTVGIGGSSFGNGSKVSWWPFGEADSFAVPDEIAGIRA